MNIFKNMFFLQGDLIDPRQAGPGEGGYTGYGNQGASEKAFKPLGHARRNNRRRDAVRRDPGTDICVTGACG